MNKKGHFQTELEAFFKITGKWILCIRSQQIARADIVFSDCINQLEKCVLEGIEPDYVIITDPKPYVHKQIERMENSTVPMILLSTAFAQVARDYKGKKYILYQKGFDVAERYAKEKNIRWLRPVEKHTMKLL